MSVAEEPESQAPGADELRRLVGSLARASMFRQLADSHLDASYRLARAILGQPSEAEDAVQDAFVQAWRHWPALRDPGRFEPWFDRILVNTCRNSLRSRARSRVDDISAELRIAQPGDQYAASNDREQVEFALSRLDADHRLIVALRFYGDFTVDEIAARTGLRPGTVKSRLHHAMRRLRSALDEPPGRGQP